MKLTEKQLDQLNSALSGLTRKHQSVVKNLLIQLVNSDLWFLDTLISILNNNTTFISRNIEVLGRFKTNENCIIINRKFLNTPNIEGLGHLFKIILRHELIHAYDYIDMKRDKYDFLVPSKVTAKNFMHFLHLADTLNDQVNCVNSNGKINIEILSQISNLNLLLDGDYKYSNLLVTTLSNYLYKISQEGIKLFGCAPIRFAPPTNLTSFILRLEQIPGSESYLLESTHDYSLAVDLYHSTASIRAITPGVNEDKYVSTFMDPSNILFWQSLSQKQRHTLDLLHILQERLLENIIKDDYCYPALQDCVVQPVENCLKSFFTCQLESNYKSSIITSTEIRAVFFERTYAKKFDHDMLKLLCVPPEKPSFYTTIMPSQQAVGQFASHFGYGASYGFLNELTESFLKHKEIHYANLVNLMLSTAFILSTGYVNYQTSEEENASVSLQIILPISIALISRSIEEIANRYASSRISQVTNAITSTIFVGAQLATTSITQLATNITASSIGNWVGKKVGRKIGSLFGWNNPGASPTLFQPAPLPIPAKSKLESKQPYCGMRSGFLNN